VRLALLAEASAELQDAATWYDDQSEGLDEFIALARACAGRLSDQHHRKSPRWLPSLS
jgi:hypothetical protein